MAWTSDLLNTSAGQIAAGYSGPTLIVTFDSIGFPDGESKDLGASCQPGQTTELPPSPENTAKVQTKREVKYAEFGEDAILFVNA